MDPLRIKVNQWIEEKMDSMENLSVPNHYHNSWDANQIDPAVGLLGFPITQVATGATGANGVTGAAGSPLDTPLNGTIRFQVDLNPKYYLWAYINYNNKGILTGAWESIQLGTSTSSSGFAEWWVPGAVGAGATNYVGLNTTAAVEATVQTIFPLAGTVSKMYIVTSSSQPASGSLVYTFRKNASDQAVTATIAAGSAAGTFSDTSNSFTFVEGDLLDVKMVNNATGTSASPSYLTFKVT